MNEVEEFVRLTAADRRQLIASLEALLDVIDSGELDAEPTERAFIAGVVHGLRQGSRR